LPGNSHDGVTMLGEQFPGCLEGALSGDAEAFRRLFRDLAPAVIRYLQVLSPSTAEDLASETWLHVVKGLPGFSGDESGFRAWVLTIAHRRHVDRVRSSARLPPEVPTEISVIESLVSEDTIAVAEEERLSTEVALGLIANLPPAQAEVVMLRTVIGLSVAEAASVVKRQAGDVRVLNHRGLRRLRQLLSEQRSGRS
jgi:RNA polymerase sigma-70 factor, ECF subfamily